MHVQRKCGCNAFNGKVRLFQMKLQFLRANFNLISLVITLKPIYWFDTCSLNASEQGKLEELVNEMALLKERNKSMEDELKEMQDRYSEISLKFAEVEGERQQLVMTLRSLKNPKKS